jgi:site-specific recombinase XerD
MDVVTNLGTSGQTELIDLCHRYLKYQAFIKNCSPHTLKAYALDLAQAFNFEKIGKWDFSRLNEGILPPLTSPSPQQGGLASSPIEDRFRVALRRWISLSPKSRARKVATLKSFASWLYQEKYIETEMSHILVSPKVPVRLPYYLSLDEVLNVLQLCKSQFSDKRSLLFVLLYGTGLRVSEACGIKWNQLNLNNRSVSIVGKGNKNRLVILPHQLIEMLKQQSRSGEYIWGEGPLNPRLAYDWIRQLGAAAGLARPIHPHLLRHTYATHLLTSGANIRVIQQLLGHESLAATEKYTHLNLQQLAQSLEQHHPLNRAKKNDKL